VAGQLLLAGGVSYVVDGVEAVTTPGMDPDLVVVAHSPNEEAYKTIMN